MLHAKFMVSAFSGVKTIKLLCLYRESGRNSVIAGVSFSQTPIAFAGDLDFARKSGVSVKRELTVFASVALR